MGKKCGVWFKTGVYFITWSERYVIVIIILFVLFQILPQNKQDRIYLDKNYCKFSHKGLKSKIYVMSGKCFSKQEQQHFEVQLPVETRTPFWGSIAGRNKNKPYINMCNHVTWHIMWCVKAKFHWVLFFWDHFISIKYSVTVLWFKKCQFL